MQTINDFMNQMLTGLIITIVGGIYTMHLLNKKAPGVAKVGKKVAGDVVGNWLQKLLR